MQEPLHETFQEFFTQEPGMSDITSITGGYTGTTISLADLAAKDNKKSAAATAAGAYVDKINARRNKTTETGGQSAGTSAEVVQAALKRAMAELSEKENGRITFSKISAYQQDLEKNFIAKMREGLQKAGLPKDTVFTLSLSKEGNIQVQCDKEDSKAAIEKYLSDNRKLCEDFGYIQALGSLQKADRQAASFGLASMSSLRHEIQASAVEAFFNSSVQSGFSPSSLTAAFSGEESAGFYSGISALV